MPVAVRVAANADPATAARQTSGEDQETVPAAWMVIRSAFVEDLPPAPTTLTLKVDLATTVGVPEMTPVVEFRLNPVGRLPDPATTDHVKSPRRRP